MTIFSRKKITTSHIHLGKRFREAREAKGWDAAQASVTASLPPRYLETIEASRFEQLPAARAYRLAYIRHYAAALGMDSAECEKQFLAEGGLTGVATQHPLRAMTHFPFSSIGVFVRNASVAVAALLFIGYLGWQVSGVVQPPRLSVAYPDEGAVATEVFTVVHGETEAESKLSVNGKEVMVTPDGKFEVKVDLTPGLNTISVASAKKRGKTAATVTRHVIVKLPKTRVSKEPAEAKKL